MEFQIALNTVILLMMIVFPGFLFRKFYFVGEFTKQFSQDTQFDKLIWNIFFSSVSIIATAICVYIFRNLTGLKLLESITYESISKVIKPIAESELPEQQNIAVIYEDLLILVGLIYFFASSLGMLSYWVVTAFALDVRFPMLRFNNYWYYYIHGGKILYNKKGKRRKRILTAVDVLCEEAGDPKLYSGILSQYVINRENNTIETIFLTNASRWKMTKNADGSTKEVVRKEIPGDTFCIPYARVLNMNFIYVYKEDESNRGLAIFLNVIFLMFLLALIASLWFDLSKFNIDGFLGKSGYFIWSLLAVSNIKLLIEYFFRIRKDYTGPIRKKQELPGQITLLLTSLLWLYYIIVGLNFWLGLGISIGLIAISSVISEQMKKKKYDSIARK